MKKKTPDFAKLGLAALERAFLWRYGNLLVACVLFAGLIVNTTLAMHFFFRRHSAVLGAWAVAAIWMLPKAVLGIVLLVGRPWPIWLNMSLLIYRLFPGTIARHRLEKTNLGTSFGTSVTLAYVRELLWAALGLFPMAMWFVRT